MSPEDLLLVALKQAEHLTFCVDCDRIFDSRSGCEADIRHDERSLLREKVRARLQIDLRSPLAKDGYLLAIKDVLELLAEPGEEQP